MNYSELTERISEQTGRSRRETRKLLKSFFNEFTRQLCDGNGFTVPGLGTFKTEVQQTRQLYNPYYKSEILVPPKRYVTFTASKQLKEKLKYTSRNP